MIACAAAPASATVQFSKEWAGAPEFDNPWGIAVDASGNSYVADGENDRIEVVDPDGALLRVWGSSGSGDGQLSGPAGVALDASGHVYVAELVNGRISEFSATGTFLRTWGFGVDDGSNAFQVCTSGCQAGLAGSGDGQFLQPQGVAIDGSGNVYVADTGNNRIQEFDATSSRSFVRKWGTSGGGSGQFSAPYGLAVDPASNDVYVAERFNNRVQRFDSTGTFELMVGKDVDQDTGDDLCTATSGHICQAAATGTAESQFSAPRGVAVDSAGNFYVTDQGNNRIQKFDSSGGFDSMWGYGVADGFANPEVCTSSCHAGQPGDNAFQYNFPHGIATDSADNVYVSEAVNNRVQITDSGGGFVPLNRFGTAGSNGQLDGASGLATDASGNVFATAFVNDLLMKFDPIGGRLLKAGGPSVSPEFQFSSPSGVAVDEPGDVYVADTLNDRIMKVTSSGGFVAMWGNDVNLTTGGDVCTAASGDSCGTGGFGSGPGEFNDPFDVDVDSSGDVYVADQGNDRIQKFDSAGNFISQLGTPGSGSGQLSFPSGVALDSADNVYVADSTNQRIDKFDASGNFVAMWGKGVNQTTGGDLCTAASGDTCGDGATGAENGQFNVPNHVSVDGFDNVYVADCSRDDVQVLRPSGVFVKKWGATGTGEGQFSCATDVAVHGANLYVSDFNNDRIEKFTETDTTAPATSFSGGPAGTTNDPTPTFSFSSSEPTGALFECRIDGGGENAYAPCTSPRTLPHLADGSHTFDVRAIDAAGNPDPTPASRSFQVKTAAVAVSGSTLLVTAAPGAADNLRVSRPSAGVLRVTDVPSGSFTGSGVHTGAGCTRVGDFAANCNSAGVALVKVAAAGLGDRVVNSTGVKSSLIGGPAADILTGGTGTDMLTGGPGADAMRGMNGNDKLFARDLTADTLINCDGGTTPRKNDSADLDTVGIDPPAIVHGCEHQTRH